MEWFLPDTCTTATLACSPFPPLPCAFVRANSQKIRSETCGFKTLSVTDLSKRLSKGIEHLGQRGSMVVNRTTLRKYFKRWTGNDLARTTLGKKVGRGHYSGTVHARPPWRPKHSVDSAGDVLSASPRRAGPRPPSERSRLERSNPITVGPQCLLCPSAPHVPLFCYPAFLLSYPRQLDWDNVRKRRFSNTGNSV